MTELVALVDSIRLSKRECVHVTSGINSSILEEA